MSSQTPQEKHAAKVENLRLALEDREYLGLLQSESDQTVRRQLKTRKRTASDRAAAIWAERVAMAHAIVDAAATDVAAILDADALLHPAKTTAPTETKPAETKPAEETNVPIVPTAPTDSSLDCTSLLE